MEMVSYEKMAHQTILSVYYVRTVTYQQYGDTRVTTVFTSAQSTSFIHFGVPQNPRSHPRRRETRPYVLFSSCLELSSIIVVIVQHIRHPSDNIQSASHNGRRRSGLPPLGGPLSTLCRNNP